MTVSSFSSSREATEADGLLTDNKNCHHDPRHTGGRDGLRTFRFVACLFLALVAILAGYTYYEHHAPQWNAQRLIDRYQKEADQALELLNKMSSTYSDTQNDIPVGCESTLLIFRHCEDLGGHVRYADGTSHCSYLGFQRSLYLATLFGNTTTTTTAPELPPARWPLPSKLYGMWNKDGTNKRQYEILVPLSEKANVEIQMFNFTRAAADLVKDIFGLLSSGKFCNNVVAIAWKHAYIRPLAARLGCDQERGCPDGYGDYDFDTVWELQYVYKPEKLRAYPEGESILVHSNEHLVDGWKVFGSVTTEGFDALSFKFGTYDSVENGTSWMQHNGHG